MQVLVAAWLSVASVNSVYAQLQDPTIVLSRLRTNDNSTYLWTVDNQGEHLLGKGFKPRVSPDRRYIVYQRDGGNGLAWNDRGDLCVMDTLLATQTVIYTHNDYLVAADFATNNLQIFYDWQCGTYRINRDGTGGTKVSDSLQWCHDDAPVVNPVNGRIAMHNTDAKRLVLADQNGQNKSWINDTTNGVCPHWSYDGQWLSFWNGTNLFKIRSNGTERTQLTFLSSSNKFPFGAAWAPDGAWVVGAGDIDGTNGLYRIATDGSGSLRLLELTDARPGEVVRYVGAIIGSIPQERPHLSQQMDQASCVIAWSTNCQGYSAEASADLTEASWQPVTNPISVQNGQFIIHDPMDSAQRYYRAARPPP